MNLDQEVVSVRAMILEAQGNPLRSVEGPVPEPGPEQVLLRVHACAVCRTDLHVVDGGSIREPMRKERSRGYAAALRFDGWTCG